MKIGLTAKQKFFIVLACFTVAFVGFMVKLPSAFRHNDKELHAAFYFMAAALLNFLFARANLVRHGIIFGALYLFGVGIELAQESSNHLFRSRIHGRFDPADLQSNGKGLLAFSLLWLLYTLAALVYKKTAAKNKGHKPAPPPGHSKPSF